MAHVSPSPSTAQNGAAGRAATLCGAVVREADGSVEPTVAVFRSRRE